MAASMVLVSLAIIAGSLFCWPGVFSMTKRVETFSALKTGSSRISEGPMFFKCCSCDFQKKTVSLHVINKLKAPKFDMKIQVTDTYRAYLLGVMQHAATVNTSWRFSATYDNEQFGFYLDAYNFVYANYSADKSYWSILDGDLTPIPKGISYYIPSDQETITFNLTKF